VPPGGGGRPSPFSKVFYKKKLPKEVRASEARKLLPSSEQNFLNLIFSLDKPNTHYIFPTAGSRLGAKHSEESITKMSGQNNYIIGKSISDDTIAGLRPAVLKKHFLKTRPPGLL
jgi:hypothetical protein